MFTVGAFRSLRLVLCSLLLTLGHRIPQGIHLWLPWWKHVKSPVEVRKKRAMCPGDKTWRVLMQTGGWDPWVQWSECSLGGRKWEGGQGLGTSCVMKLRSSRAGQSAWEQSQGQRIGWEPQQKTGRAEACRELVNGDATFQLRGIMWWYLVPGTPILQPAMCSFCSCTSLVLEYCHHLFIQNLAFSLNPLPALSPAQGDLNLQRLWRAGENPTHSVCSKNFVGETFSLPWVCWLFKRRVS